MIESIKRNRMGTVSFKAKFGRMLKPQEFITYAIKEGDDTTKLLIQSDTRIGHIWLKSGIVTMSPPHASGAYGRHPEHPEAKAWARARETNGATNDEAS